jgi:hypothetical protein
MDTVLPALADRSILWPGVLEREPSAVVPIREDARVPPAAGVEAMEAVIVGMRSVLRRCAVAASPAWKDCDMSCSSPEPNKRCGKEGS